MVKKPKQPPETAELKKQIETIVGHEIDPGAERFINLFHPAGSYALFFMDQSAQACWRRIFPFPSKDCSIVRLLEAAGVSSTLADGKRVFQVSDVLCPEGVLWSFGEPINVVATPLADSPTLLTMTYSLISQGPDPSFQPDVQMTVFTWNADGSPAPNVVFDWRCRAVVLSNPPSSDAGKSQGQANELA
jgi:hypothetical protein